MQATEIRLVTELDQAISRGDRDAWAVPVAQEPTRANLALAMDTADHRRISLGGVYGGIGCGETHVEIDTDDGDTLTVVATDQDEPVLDTHAEIGYFDASGAMPETGELDRDELSEITGSVWDGNNHVEFVPVRAQDYCEDEDSETEPWGTIHYGFDGQNRYIANTTVRDGWVLLGWDDCGGYDGNSASALNQAQFDALWEMRCIRGRGVGLPDCIEEFAEDASDARALFCRGDDVARVKQIVDGQIEA